MSVNEKMTAIADKIRALLGISGAMGLDAMANNLAAEQTNVSAAFTAIGNKGGTVPPSKVSGNLASAIVTIPTGSGGVTVQRKEGGATTDSDGFASVNCGFQPDVVLFTNMYLNSRYECHAAVVFPEQKQSSYELYAMAQSDDMPDGGYFDVVRTQTGFNVLLSVKTEEGEQFADNVYFTFVAIKYTV